MEWKEKVCIVAGDNRAWKNSDGHKTAIELWCRSKSGHSTLLIVNGLRPFVEISDCRSEQRAADSPLSLVRVSSMHEVEGLENLGEKLSQDGLQRVHYRVFVRDTRFVRSVRKRLSESGWTVTSADILFVQRLMLDLQNLLSVLEQKLSMMLMGMNSLPSTN